MRTNNISRGISRPITHKIVSNIFNPQVRGQSTPINPWDIEGLQYRGLDESTFNDNTIYTANNAGDSGSSFKWYLRDRSTSDSRIPRQGRCYTFTGAEYISVPSLTGSETVDFKEGTGTVSISTGRIDVTSGTLWNLTLSNGSVYLCNEEEGRTAYDIVNGNHGTIVSSAATNTFHTVNSSIATNDNNLYGYEYAENILDSTENFTTGNSTRTDITVNPTAIVAPDGQTTGNLITEGTAGTAQLALSVFPDAEQMGNAQTVSIYLKAGTAPWVSIACFVTGLRAEIWVDPVNGVLGQQAITSTATVIPEILDKTITSVDNGWYRVTLTAILHTSSAYQVSIKSAIADGSSTRQNNSTYYLWGSQANYGSTALPYLASTTLFRFLRPVYIPKLKNSSQSARNNALSNTGKCLYSPNVKTRCWASEGSPTFIDTGLSLIPATGDFSISFWTRVSAFIGSRGFLSLGTNAGVGRLGLSTSSSNMTLLLPNGSTSLSLAVLSGLSNRWVKIVVGRQGTTYSLSVNNRKSSVTDATAIVPASLRIGIYSTATYPNSGTRFADFQVTANGVTTYIPLQDGPGTSSNNRNISWVDSAGNGDVVANAISGGTPATQWANYVTGEAKDWCVQYGGGIAPNGAFVPGHISGGNTATGVPKSLVPGKFGNPWSQIDFNPDLAAEFNGRSIPRTWKIGDAFPGTITPSNAAFLRSKADGVDRLFIYESELTDKNLESVQNYIA